MVANEWPMPNTIEAPHRDDDESRQPQHHDETEAEAEDEPGATSPRRTRVVSGDS